MQTKTQQKREARYRKQLKKCGFRSWKKANQRRGELIDQEIETGVEPEGLADLQKLCDLYLKWKTNDVDGRQVRRLKRLGRKLGIVE